MRCSTTNQILKKKSKKNIAIMLSGSGTNAEKIIEFDSRFYEVKLLFSDNPDSNCKKIAEKYDISYEIYEIYDFYKDTSINDLIKRREYDKKISSLFKENDIDIVALAGYRWLITKEIFDSFLTFNIHPGDLRVIDKNGKRKYTGLGWVPIAKAILNDEENVFSTVHIVNGELDGGNILCISDPVKLEIDEETVQKIKNGPSIRKIKKSHDMNESVLYKISCKFQEILKMKGDWIVYPKCIEQMIKEGLK